MISFIAGVLNLLVPAYPQIKIVPLCVPPNQNYMPFAYPQIKNSTQKGFFWAFFFNFAYPLWPSHIPLGQWFSTFFSLRHLFTLNYFCDTYNFFWRHTQFLKHAKLIDYIMFAREEKPSIHSYDTKFYEKRCFQMFLIYKI